MKIKMANKFLLASMFLSSYTSSAFLALSERSFCHHGSRSTTALNLEDHIADMIDKELYRLNHKKEAEDLWLRKQREWSRMEPKIPSDYDFEGSVIEANTFITGSESEDDVALRSVQGFTSGVDRSISSPQRRKDKKLALNDPARYCADRCVTTGNCDVFEDIFEMGPDEVIKFCKECVLSEEEEPCDVPPSVFGDDNVGLHP